MKQGTAELLLLTVIVSRSISYVLSKIGLNGMPPLELLSIRFFLTTVILLILFHKRLPQITPALFKSAGLLGTLLFGCMACELISLTTVASSTVAFLENTSVVWVLLLMAVRSTANGRENRYYWQRRCSLSASLALPSKEPLSAWLPVK